MPELPEVETSRRGIEPHIIDSTVSRVVIRERRLRWPVSKSVDRSLTGQTVTSVGRRAKYLLINTDKGSAILHLGMSGSVCIVERGAPAGIHDHVDIEFESGLMLRYRDPRRFGSLHWSRRPLSHPLLARLGPEPLGADFDGDYLWQTVAWPQGQHQAVHHERPHRRRCRQHLCKRGPVHGRHPSAPRRRSCGAAPLPDVLARSIRDVLKRAIRAGGTTLRDFYGGDGEAGYFQQQLDVYGREDEPCRRCDAPITAIVQGQRVDLLLQELPDLISQSQLFPQRASSACLTSSDTNSETSPPSEATSRTRLEEMNVYFSVGVRNTVSTSSVRWRFILAS